VSKIPIRTELICILFCIPDPVKYNQFSVRKAGGFTGAISIILTVTQPSSQNQSKGDSGYSMNVFQLKHVVLSTREFEVLALIMINIMSKHDIQPVVLHPNF
jgi:hypothetical protein